MRLGFAITSHPVAARLRAALGAWPVSTRAIEYGLAAFGDPGWAAAQRGKLKAGAAALDALLARFGFRNIVGTALFRFAEHVHSHGVFQHLAKSGILTRPYRDVNALRLGLPGSDEERERLSEALSSLRF